MTNYDAVAGRHGQVEGGHLRTRGGPETSGGCEFRKPRRGSRGS